MKDMVFLYKKRLQEGDFTKYLYYFHDHETGESEVVEQYD
jgi:hypothetical protein